MTEIVSGFSEASMDAAIASAMSQIISNLGGEAQEMVFSVSSAWKDESGFHAQVMAVPKIGPSEPEEEEEKPSEPSEPKDKDEAEEMDEYYLMGHPYIVPQTDLEKEQIEEGRILVMDKADQPYLEEYKEPVYDKTEMQKAAEQGTLSAGREEKNDDINLELPGDDILEPKSPDDDAMTLTPDMEEAAHDMEEEFKEAKNPANDQIRKSEPVPATSPHPEPDGTVEKEDVS